MKKRVLSILLVAAMQLPLQRVVVQTAAITVRREVVRSHLQSRPSL